MKRRMHRIIVISIILILILITGCAKQEPGQEATELPPTAPSLTASPEPEPEAVESLDCLRPDALPTFLPAENGSVLACRTDYEANTTQLALIDIAGDLVIDSRILEGSWSLYEETFTDGGFALRDIDNHIWKFVDKELEDAGEFPASDMNGVFSHDRSAYYSLTDSVLCRFDVAGSTMQRVETDPELRFLQIVSIHPNKDIIALHFRLSAYDSACGTAILNITTGEYISIREELYQPYWSEELCCLPSFDYEQMGYAITFGSEQDGFRYADASVFRGENSELLTVDGSPFLLAVGEDTTLFSLGDSVLSCSLSEAGMEGELRSACWIPSKSRIICTTFREGNFLLYSVYPDKLSMAEAAAAEQVESPLSVQTELADAYWNELSGGELPDSLLEARQYANRLEEEYDVRILLSSQCAGACELSVYEMTTTDLMGFGNEAREICRALESLEQSLALYPDGFFSQFKNDMGEGGIRFLPVGAIVSDHGVIGVSFENNYWHNIAIDVRMDELNSTICHEIWHATEDKILSADHTYFDPDIWAALNPEGFSYYGQTAFTDPDQERWTLFGTGDEEIYFVDSYARVNEREDRARIMEFIMTKDEYCRALMSSPAISQKLRIMCSAIRGCFDTTQWNDVRWERFFDQ